MSTKDISDRQVCLAFQEYQSAPFNNRPLFVYEILERDTGQCRKVCYRAMERAEERDYVEYGVSLRTGWLTEKGKELIK